MRVSKGKKEAIIHYEVSSRFDLKLNELEKSYRDEIEKEVLKTIPAKVMKVHEDGWCNSSSSVNIDGFENKVN
ncbi:MAG: hypothetical protein HWN79_17680, partial [Candidatus Lokiarchaeota archaeon]|nr:hypothetical protein [Candidatus Lokiarchaeota archaeon]